MISQTTFKRFIAVFMMACLGASWILSLVGCGQATGDVSMDDIKNNMKQSAEIKQKNPGTGGNRG